MRKVTSAYPLALASIEVLFLEGITAQLEHLIENQCLQWLAWKSIFSWKTKTIGTYDPKIQRFRRTSPLYRKGVSDIIAIYKGKCLAIEVKSPKGQLSTEQVQFQKDVTENGGIAFTVRSVEDLEDEINKLNKEESGAV